MTYIKENKLNQFALSEAINILHGWTNNAAIHSVILDIPDHDIQTLSNDNILLINKDQLERIQLVINIHHWLSLLFSNPDNQTGFMTMVNHNPYFNGKTPLSFISNGDKQSLESLNTYLVSKVFN